MPTYNTARVASQPFVVDRDSLSRDTGHSVDWDNVPAGETYGPAGSRRLPAGTRVGRQADGRIIPRSETVPAFGILETDAAEDSRTDALSGYGVLLGGVFYENRLPGATGTPPEIPAAEKTELNASGTGFSFQQYVDSSAL